MPALALTLTALLLAPVQAPSYDNAGLGRTRRGIPVVAVRAAPNTPLSTVGLVINTEGVVQSAPLQGALQALLAADNAAASAVRTVLDRGGQMDIATTNRTLRLSLRVPRSDVGAAWLVAHHILSVAPSSLGADDAMRAAFAPLFAASPSGPRVTLFAAGDASPAQSIRLAGRMVGARLLPAVRPAPGTPAPPPRPTLEVSAQHWAMATLLAGGCPQSEGELAAQSLRARTVLAHRRADAAELAHDAVDGYVRTGSVRWLAASHEALGAITFAQVGPACAADNIPPLPAPLRLADVVQASGVLGAATSAPAADGGVPAVAVGAHVDDSRIPLFTALAAYPRGNTPPAMLLLTAAAFRAAATPAARAIRGLGGTFSAAATDDGVLVRATCTTPNAALCWAAVNARPQIDAATLIEAQGHFMRTQAERAPVAAQTAQWVFAPGSAPVQFFANDIAIHRVTPAALNDALTALGKPVHLSRGPVSPPREAFVPSTEAQPVWPTVAARPVLTKPWRGLATVLSPRLAADADAPWMLLAALEAATGGQGTMATRAAGTTVRIRFAQPLAPGEVKARVDALSTALAKGSVQRATFSQAQQARGDPGRDIDALARQALIEQQSARQNLPLKERWFAVRDALDVDAYVGIP